MPPSTMNQQPAANAHSTPSSELKCKSRKPFNDIHVNAPSRSTPAKKSIIREWEKLETTTTSTACSSTEEQTIIESSTFSRLEKEQVQPTESVFRTPTLVSEDMDDLLSLKRANPVFDDDEADIDEMPAKRQRRNTTDDETTRELTLHWDDRIVQDGEGGYQIVIGPL